MRGKRMPDTASSGVYSTPQAPNVYSIPNYSSGLYSTPQYAIPLEEENEDQYVIVRGQSDNESLLSESERCLI